VSQENLEIVRRGYEAMNKRAFPRMSEFLHPEVEFDLSRNIMNPASTRDSTASSVSSA
jgi:ketosteroid isomerase-like protein